LLVLFYDTVMNDEKDERVMCPKMRGLWWRMCGAYWLFYWADCWGQTCFTCMSLSLPFWHLSS